MVLFRSANKKLRDAAYDGEVNKVRELIAKGADVNAGNSCGDTPLHIASEEGELQTVKVLIAAGADVNARCEEGETPLHKASGDVDDVKEVTLVKIVEALIAAGADVRAENEDGKTPRDFAASNGHGAVVELLNRAQAPAQAPAQSKPDASKGAAFYQKIVDLGQGEWGKEGIHEELKDIGASIADLHMLKIFYSLVSSLRRTGEISDKAATRHVLNSLTTSVELCTCSSSIATYKIVLEKASDDGHLSKFDWHRLDNEAEVARMSQAPFVQDITASVRRNTAKIKGLEANVKSINNSVNKIRKGIQHKAQVEGAVGMISATLNALSFGVGGTAVQMFLNQVVDFGDIVHLETTAAALGGELLDQVKSGIETRIEDFVDSKIEEAVKEGKTLLVVSAAAAMMYDPAELAAVLGEDEMAAVLGEDDPDASVDAGISEGAEGEGRDGGDEVKDWLLGQIKHLKEEDAAKYRDCLAEKGFDCIELMEDLEEEDLNFMKVAHRRKLSRQLTEEKIG